MNKKPLFAVGVVLTMTLAVGGAVILLGTRIRSAPQAR